MIDEIYKEKKRQEDDTLVIKRKIRENRAKVQRTTQEYAELGGDLEQEMKEPLPPQEEQIRASQMSQSSAPGTPQHS